MQERAVTISVVDNGFVANVGCVTLVFPHLGELMDALQQYLTDPEKARQEWQAKLPRLRKRNLDADPVAYSGPTLNPLYPVGHERL
jgi:hypothetical protein